jgi:lipopolysaccharide transport system ATP-binding protein
MSDPAIRVESLGKKYLIRHLAPDRHKNYTALRDVLAEAALAPFRRRRDDEAANGAGSGGAAGGREEFWALRDVSFEIKRGEAVGVIGRNGAGKSTLLKLLGRITEPSSGQIVLNGKVASLLEVGTGFHPELTGRENIYLNGAILGMKRAEVRGKFDEIVAFAEVEQFLDTPVKHYSSGMYVRLAFAVAAHLDPDILIVDEVLAVGDASFQKRCLGKMREATEREGRTVLFVSHNMQAVRQMCRRAIFLKEGRVAGDGDPPAVIGAYLGHGSEAEAQSVVDLAAHPRRRNVESGGFERLSFRDGQGRAAMRVNLRDTLEVEILIRARKPMKQLNVAMAVVHAEGLRVFSEAYSDQHALPDLAPGDYTLRFHVPMRFFKLESYFLVLAMSENGQLCDEIEGLPMPEIVDENPNLQVESHRWGVLRVPVTWDEIKPAVSGSG